MEKTKFYGDRLRLARVVKGLTQTELANAVEANVSTVSRLEKGLIEPTPVLFGALCHILDFTASFFARPVFDEYTVNNCSFHITNSTPRRLLDRAMARGTAFQEAVSVVSTLVSLPDLRLPCVPIQNVNEIEAAAELTRHAFGLSLRAPLVSVIQLADHAGVVVTRMNGSFERIDAFSHAGEPPVIVLPASRYSATQERVKVAREIGHLVMHAGLRVDSEMQLAADRFARALLMPSQVFRDEFLAMPVHDWAHLFDLKKRWKAPVTEIISRAFDLDLLSGATVRRLMKQYSWQRWHQGEPYEIVREESELLTHALEFAEKDTGETLATLAETLGWGTSVAEEITGLAMPDWDVFGGNVARFADYRRA